MHCTLVTVDWYCRTWSYFYFYFLQLIPTFILYFNTTNEKNMFPKNRLQYLYFVGLQNDGNHSIKINSLAQTNSSNSLQIISEYLPTTCTCSGDVTEIYRVSLVLVDQDTGAILETKTRKY